VPPTAGLDVKTMFLMSVATSIDALAVGITFAFVPVKLFAGSAAANALTASAIIGVTTFSFSFVGVKAGNIFGIKYKSRAEFAGGVILILIGLKIILEHFGVL
jgi:putative Mn2+ efflux pump MntP